VCDASANGGRIRLFLLLADAQQIVRLASVRSVEIAATKTLTIRYAVVLVTVMNFTTIAHADHLDESLGDLEANAIIFVNKCTRSLRRGQSIDVVAPDH